MTEAAAEPAKWRTNLVLFLATVASVFVTGVLTNAGSTADDGASMFAAFLARDALVKGGQFAGTLLTILVAHELGHYVAARIHKVDASLPYFIPMPLLSPFGTMGAVIRMRGVIPTRRALLDIGAAGPLAGMVFAIPLYAWGVAHSKIVQAGGDGMVQLGESILMKLLDHAAAPPVPEGMDLELSPVAFGAWGGMFVTMINLLPVGQLDGGHVAYALFGTKQDRYAQLVHRAMLVFFFVAIAGHIGRDLSSGLGLYYLGRHLGNSIFWLVWFQVLAILGILAARGRGERKEPSLSISTRAAATVGLLIVASTARDSRSPVLPLAFFLGLGMLLVMERRAGVLRPHSLLDHPPTGAAPLDRGRAAIAIVSLVLFVLLFMPEPISM